MRKKTKRKLFIIIGVVVIIVCVGAFLYSWLASGLMVEGLIHLFGGGNG